MKPFRILVVDDEQDVRKYLVRKLQAEGLTVDEAEDGDQAIAVFSQHLQPVVLLDLRLPGRDGIDVLRYMKQQRPETQVVILTGHGSCEDAIAGLNLHAFQFIEKPPDMDVILLAVENAFEVHSDLIGDAMEITTTGDPPSLEEVRRATAAIPVERISEKQDQDR